MDQDANPVAVEHPRGIYPGRVDEKGRLKLPADFQQYLTAIGEKKVFCTTFDERIARLYPISKWKETEALLKGWFIRIVVNTCIDHLRRTHLKLVSQEISEEGETFADSQESGIDKLMYREIIEAIRKLTPVYRTVFNLFVIEGFSHEEIASQLNISVGASKSNLSKARHNLRKIITQQTEYKAYV